MRLGNAHAFVLQVNQATPGARMNASLEQGGLYFQSSKLLSHLIHQELPVRKWFETQLRF
jgi:hypothetical protein